MNLDISKTNITFSPSSPISVGTMIKGMDDYDNHTPSFMKVNYRPSYQRGEAWDTDFKEKLILSVLVNFPIGNIILRTLKTSNTSFNEVTHEVVDGQQRLLALRSFINGGFKLGYLISDSLLRDKGVLFEYDLNSGIKNNASKIYAKFLENSDFKVKLGFIDLPTSLQTQILNYGLNVILVESNDEAIAQYFRFIQNQERLRAGEIINSIPDSLLLKYLLMIKDKEKFLSKIRWNESRKEFEKIFYSMIGVFEKKLYFGTTDVSIIDYVGNCESINSEGEADTLRMIGAINAITECDVQNRGKFSKRLIKYLLLSAGFGIIDYTTETDKKFKLLLEIESKLPSFNSGDAEKVKETFPDYSPNAVEAYNQLFILGRGSHSSDSTRKVLESLKSLMSYEAFKRGESICL